MKLAVLLATIGLALTIEAHAQPLGSLAEISVIDRETGAALSPHYYRGEYWVAAALVRSRFERSERGRTPRGASACRRATLLAAGADTNAADSSGTTPLRAALAGAHSAIAAALEQSGAR